MLTIGDGSIERPSSVAFSTNLEIPSGEEETGSGLNKANDVVLTDPFESDGIELVCWISGAGDGTGGRGKFSLFKPLAIRKLNPLS